MKTESFLARVGWWVCGCQGVTLVHGGWSGVMLVHGGGQGWGGEGKRWSGGDVGTWGVVRGR